LRRCMLRESIVTWMVTEPQACMDSLHEWVE
jgi:hypothetical protein